MASQPPTGSYNPYMFQFPYPYPPPPFMNPMMHGPSRNGQPHSKGQSYPYPPMSMPPYGFPPFPMMFPPSPDHYFPFFGPKPLGKDCQHGKSFNVNKELNANIPEERKAQTENHKTPSKKQSAIIVLSDDEQKPIIYKRVEPNSKKDDYICKLKINATDEPQLRRTERKVIASSIVQSLPMKTHQIQKRKQHRVIKQKEKNSKQIEKELNQIAMATTDSNNQTSMRNKRIRILTAKDGKGKIMLGDQFQTKLPEYVPKDQSFTIWIDDVRKNILSRSFQ